MAECPPLGCTWHLYAASLRWETRLLYRVGENSPERPQRWRLLPLQWSGASEGTCIEAAGLVCILQALCTTTRSPEKRWRESLDANWLNPEGLPGKLSAALANHRVRSHGVDGPDWARSVHEALRGGGLGLLRWTALRAGHSQHHRPARLPHPPPPAHWALVLGMEWVGGVGDVWGAAMERPALLLFDPATDPVWGCAHNAHLGLARPQGAASTSLLRSLDGGSRRIVVSHLVTVVPGSC